MSSTFACVVPNALEKIIEFQQIPDKCMSFMVTNHSLMQSFAYESIVKSLLGPKAPYTFVLSTKGLYDRFLSDNEQAASTNHNQPANACSKKSLFGYELFLLDTLETLLPALVNLQVFYADLSQLSYKAVYLPTNCSHLQAGERLRRLISNVINQNSSSITKCGILGYSREVHRESLSREPLWPASLAPDEAIITLDYAFTPSDVGCWISSLCNLQHWFLTFELLVNQTFLLRLTSTDCSKTSENSKSSLTPNLLASETIDDILPKLRHVTFCGVMENTSWGRLPIRPLFILPQVTTVTFGKLVLSDMRPMDFLSPYFPSVSTKSTETGVHDDVDVLHAIASNIVLQSTMTDFESRYPVENAAEKFKQLYDMIAFNVKQQQNMTLVSYKHDAVLGTNSDYEKLRALIYNFIVPVLQSKPYGRFVKFRIILKLPAISTLRPPLTPPLYAVLLKQFMKNMCQLMSSRSAAVLRNRVTFKVLFLGISAPPVNNNHKNVEHEASVQCLEALTATRTLQSLLTFRADAKACHVIDFGNFANESAAAEFNADYAVAYARDFYRRQTTKPLFKWTKHNNKPVSSFDPSSTYGVVKLYGGMKALERAAHAAKYERQCR